MSYNNSINTITPPFDPQQIFGNDFPKNVAPAPRRLAVRMFQISLVGSFLERLWKESGRGSFSN